MSLILEQMLNLKLPLNRISQYLSRYGARYSRQQTLGDIIVCDEQMNLKTDLEEIKQES